MPFQEPAHCSLGQKPRSIHRKTQLPSLASQAPDVSTDIIDILESMRTHPPGAVQKSNSLVTFCKRKLGGSDTTVFLSSRNHPSAAATRSFTHLPSCVTHEGPTTVSFMSRCSAPSLIRRLRNALTLRE